MLFDIKLDVLEDDIYSYSPKLLNLLLCDKTTKKNIIWATDDYVSSGSEYQNECEIKPELITGKNSMLIRPRVAKSLEAQENRTKGRAEVFTPCWVCNTQNNLVDYQWFGRSDVFNVEQDKDWTETSNNIDFQSKGNKTWKKYVDAKRLEVSCGEAPYLVSRYDTVTGKMISLKRRIGLLDRKLRVVSENTSNEKEWFDWTLRAYQSIYGYEFQGDNLLLARENLFASFIEYFQDKFGGNPSLDQLIEIASVISWNIWQMDGMKYVVPYSCKTAVIEQCSLFGSVVEEVKCPGCEKDDIYKHNGIYCKVFDWREKNSLTFVSMIKGGIRHG